MRESPVEVLRLALCFGLAMGLAEASVLATQALVLHQWIYQGRDLVWAIPLAHVGVFTVAGFGLVFAGFAWPALSSLRIAVGLFTFLAAAGPLLFVPRLHNYAGIVLAAGLGVQASRLAAGRAAGFRILARRVTPLLVAAIAVVAVATIGWEKIAERRALAGLPPADPAAPNVLLVVLDTVRAKSLGLYGYRRPTSPNLEILAAGGVTFERALSPSPWTLPAHAAIFTGRYPHETPADWLTSLDTTSPTLAEAFAARGYVTAGFVANLVYCRRETGIARGFLHYEDYPVSLGMVVNSTWLTRFAYNWLNLRLNRWLFGARGHLPSLVVKRASDVNRAFLSWLDQHSSRPFFAFLNYFDAHAPYYPPPPFDDIFGPTGIRPPLLTMRTWSPQEHQVQIDAYDGALAYVDRELGRLMDEFGRRGLRERTLVIVTSDHGEHLGEHGLVDHGNSLYRPVLHVPLVISFAPRVPAGRRVPAAVTLRDLPATVLDLVPLAGAPPFPGTSLARHWTSAATVGDRHSPVLAEVTQSIRMPDWWPSSKGTMRALIADGMHYIRSGGGKEELYDLERDPEEHRNLAASDSGRAVLERLRAALDAIPRRDERAEVLSSRRAR